MSHFSTKLDIDIIQINEYNESIIMKVQRTKCMKYLSTSQVAEKWKISARRVAILCEEERIKGVQKAGSTWIIPDNATKPADNRVKSGKYIKTVSKEKNSL